MINEIIIDLIRTFFIIILTYYMNLKFTYKRISENWIKKLIILIEALLISMLSVIIKENFGFFYSLICITMLIGLIFSKNSKSEFVYALVITVISLSINYIIFSISILLSFIVNTFISINSEYINLAIMLLIYILLEYYLLKIKRFKKGIIFFKAKLKNGYFEILILNISMMILFCVILLSNYKKLITSQVGAGLVIFSIIMFITIQKSLQLYYKQKLIIQDLDETKKELEDKNKEIKELEKENLNLSKINHSVAHKQKSLEYKLNQLILKNEIAEELDIKDKMNNISRELDNQKTVELTKTNISEIDDMLRYMQSECIKNNIDFELQISENINHMINKVIPKENLEILIADHIKNSIIAIKHSKNSNKSILVRIGLIDGIYSIYVYDSGIEFEIETLKNLGIKPSSTHLNDGGSGMGFMNTFDTLNKFYASIIINEYGKESKDNYTKYIAIKFDSRHEFKIYSYRADKIKEKNNNKNIIIESRDLK